MFFHCFFQILQLQMNDYKYHYLFTTFDMEAFDLEDFKYNFVNITAFRIVDIDDISVKETIRSMMKFQPNKELRFMNSTYIQVTFFILLTLHLIFFKSVIVKKVLFRTLRRKYFSALVNKIKYANSVMCQRFYWFHMNSTDNI